MSKQIVNSAVIFHTFGTLATAFLLTPVTIFCFACYYFYFSYSLLDFSRFVGLRSTLPRRSVLLLRRGLHTIGIFFEKKLRKKLLINSF